MLTLVCPTEYFPHGSGAAAAARAAAPSEPLTTNSGMGAIVRAMQRPDSGLEVKDRLWLKITISNAFIGCDVVDWLNKNVTGFSDRREARKYVSQMLKAGFVKHGTHKSTFSEQCYYTFGEEATITAGFAEMSVKQTPATMAVRQQVNLPQLPAAVAPQMLPPQMHQQLQQQQTWFEPASNNSGVWTGGGASAASPLSGLVSDANSSSPNTTTYNGGNATIYNPAAPPPSANYMSFQTGQDTGSGIGDLLLAGSGSGSGTDSAVGSVIRVGGRGGAESESVVSSSTDGGFRAAMAMRQQQQNMDQNMGFPQQSMEPNLGFPAHSPPAYTANC